MEDLKKAFEIINKNAEEGRFSGPKAEELILMAERVLSLKFPPTYKEFLRRFGAGSIFGVEIYGITRAEFINASIPNGIWLTLREREDIQLPNNLIIIYDYDDGVYFAIDTSIITAEQENPVVAWAQDLPDNQIKIIAPDFGKFLLKIILEANE